MLRNSEEMFYESLSATKFVFPPVFLVRLTDGFLQRAGPDNYRRDDRERYGGRDRYVRDREDRYKDDRYREDRPPRRSRSPRRDDRARSPPRSRDYDERRPSRYEDEDRDRRRDDRERYPSNRSNGEAGWSR